MCPMRGSNPQPSAYQAIVPSSCKILTGTEYLQFSVICSELSLWYTDTQAHQTVWKEGGERGCQMRLSEHLDQFHRSLPHTWEVDLVFVIKRWNKWPWNQNVYIHSVSYVLYCMPVSLSYVHYDFSFVLFNFMLEKCLHWTKKKNIPIPELR